MSSSAALLAASSRQLRPGAYAYEVDSLAWQQVPRGTAREKCVRRDDVAGLYLGIVQFDPLTRSGVHQHLATATSYFLSGSLTDHTGTTGEGCVGINLAGATHDAVSYPGCVLVSRLEGPVIVPDGGLAVHPHAASAPVRPGNAEAAPDISVPLASAPMVPTRFAGLGRRSLFDYAGTGDDRRMCSLTLWPKCPPLRVRHEGLTDFFLLSGDLSVDGKPVSGPCFVIFEPGTEATLASDYGCLLLAWAEGPGRSPDTGAELYGFGST